MQQQNNSLIVEDEIDLKELFLIIWKNRIFILFFTFFITFFSIIYINFKPHIPLYQGKLLLQIGKIIRLNEILIDNPEDLKIILQTELNLTDLKVEIPKNSKNLIELIVINKNKQEIEAILKNTYQFILNRHEEKIKNFDMYIKTVQIGKIDISNEMVNKPKKVLITVVAFITGLIFSIFIVFIREFLQNGLIKES